MKNLFPLSAVLAGTVVTAALVSTAMPAAAVSFDLTSKFVTGNNTYNLDSQLKIELSDAGTNQVTFKFTNIGGTTSSITDIYFGKAGTINNYFLLPATISDSFTNVNFEQGANPENTAGEFKWDAAYTAGSDKPGDKQKGQPVLYGVNNYFGSNPDSEAESVSFTFNTKNNYTAEDIVKGFLGDIPDLAIALKVQGIGPNASDSAWYGTNGVDINDIPEPFTMLGTAVALGFGAAFQHEQKRRKKQAIKA